MENDDDLRILKISEIKKKLEKYPGWEYGDNKITKKFEFESFNQALLFINTLAPYCNKIDHHPDIHIYYKKVVFDLSRFSVGDKVTIRDFAVASEIERLYSKFET